MDLDKALENWKLGRLKYPQLRRQSEDAFFGELVAQIKALEERLAPFEGALDSGMWPVPPDPKADRMAAARAAKAEKRAAGPLEAA